MHTEKGMDMTNQLMKRIILIACAAILTMVCHAQSEEESNLLFLYENMSLPDRIDYDSAYYRQQVRLALQARREMPWGTSVPEREFRHFVLPPRVSNEDLDTARAVFFRELKPRVQGLTMCEAVLEVNHWCHEHVTYRPTDARTLSPLATYRTAYGRCGEESVFTVAALRAVGIPARQVYTPRWAHTDDNHAWVEAWADGRWWFLGACEPEPILNMGWFNESASRGMLMHTKVFGNYDGPEEVVNRQYALTEINVIGNYAPARRLTVTVLDSLDHPVPDVAVGFKVYNYAEFFTVAAKLTDAAGQASLTAGHGDMLVWASKDGQYGYANASFGRDKRITIKLGSVPSEQELDIVPPAERVLIPEVPVELRKENQRRLAYEDSLRHAYEATFMPRNMALRYSARFADLLVQSRGNWPTILTFIENHRGQEERAYKLLSSLTDKDLRDMPMEILDDNMNAESDQLCPRVENEMIIRPFKHLFEKAFDTGTRQEMKTVPSRLVKWVKENIHLNPDKKALRIAQTPAGVWESRVTDTRSRDIFFVTLARSLGIEARKDVVTGKVQYRKQAEGKWVDVDFEAAVQTVSKQGTLVLTYEPTKLLDDPKYYSHFTLSRITPSGATNLLNFEEGQVDMGGGTSWTTTFRNSTPLDAGTYLLTTGTRLANGSVLATNRIFTVEEGRTTTLPLRLRQSETEVCVIGYFDAESRYTPLASRQPGSPVSILSQTGRGYFVVGLVGMGQEPTNHALRDIAKVANDFDQWGRPLLLLFESEEEAQKFREEDFGQLPKNTLFGIDRDGSIRRQIATQMKMQSGGQLPVFIIADTFNRVVFCSEGYTIGLGEQLQRVIKKL